MKQSNFRVPLESIRVLALTRLIPGAICTSILGDAGAEVIKIEEPGIGNYERQNHPFIGPVASRFLILNRNKKSVAVNLKRKEGRALLLKMVGSADVLIESFRPGTTAKLGIDYPNLEKINPCLIYCSISGFGHESPCRDVVAHDINILGMAGVLDITGTTDGSPAIAGIQIADSVAGMNAVTGILLSSIRRGREERGQFIDISMFDGVISLIFDAARYNFAGDQIPTRGKGRLWGGFPNYAVYETKDQKYIAVGSLEFKFKSALLKKLGREDLLQDKGETTSTQPASSYEELCEFLRKTFLTKTRDEWVSEFSELNICLGPVNSIEEALLHPAAIFGDMVMDLVHPVAGKHKQIGTPLKSTRPLANPDRLPAPGLGEHSMDLLLELGYEENEIKFLMQSGVLQA